MGYHDRKFLSELLKTAGGRRTKDLSKMLDAKEKVMRSVKRPTSVTGTYRGQFFRIKLPRKQQRRMIPKLPLPGVGNVPKPLKPTPSTGGSSVSAKGSTTGVGASASSLRQSEDLFEDFWKRTYAWWRANAAVLIMNFGSVCTLLAFTRSDVLELRTLSVSGSGCFIVYSLLQPQIQWLSIAWTSLFGSVNLFKIYQIIQERNANVRMTEEEENIFVRFFMTHGITPKQFEQIAKKAHPVHIKKGEVVVREGDRFEHIYLVVDGTTHASILRRYVTAASTKPSINSQKKEGGNSGAWVGEMSFLEAYGEESLKRTNTKKGDEKQKESSSTAPTSKNEELMKKSFPNPRSGTRAMFTVLAMDDCLIWSWSHDDMKELMEFSTDMRAGLTRAMTSAVVGKVINFTISHADSNVWSKWIQDWKYKDEGQICEVSVNETLQQKNATAKKEAEAKNLANDLGSGPPLANVDDGMVQLP